MGRGRISRHRADALILEKHGKPDAHKAWHKLEAAWKPLGNRFPCLEISVQSMEHVYGKRGRGFDMTAAAIC
jgi:hypothetical protein